MQTTVGKLQVQQLNYAYTLQGWLKSVNAGWDGSSPIASAGLAAAPAYGFSLHYYQGDYRAIGQDPATTTTDVIFNGIGSIEGNTPAGQRPLYNGNIAAMAVNIPALATNNTGNTGKPMLYHYQYDQLNRITGMDALYSTTAATGGNTGLFAGLGKLVEYHEAAMYDPNGNIVNYQRNGNVLNSGATSAPMDNLHYHYIAATNQLSYIADDEGAAHTGMGDIGTQAAGNYTYDAIGNLIKNTQEGIDNISWTVYGKISSITKSNNDGSPATKINYSYDVAGNRISKVVTPYTNGVTGSPVTTWYVRDASGNVMSIYTAGGGSSAANGGNLTVSEVPLYGSSRLGMVKPGTDVQTNLYNSAAGNLNDANGTAYFLTTFTRGQKLFELSNHLGNVLVTVTDKKVGVDAGSDGAIESYTADIANANDYYPGGSIEPGRQYNAGTQYRYGFNGQEKSDEIGNGLCTAEYWEYDSRIGRRWNLEPKGDAYTSPYVTFKNNPIWFNDRLGDTAAVFKPDGSFWKIPADGKKGWTILQYTQSEVVIHKVNGVSTTFSVYSKPKSYQFADPINDPKDIKAGKINQLVFVDMNKIADMLGKAGAFDPENRAHEYSYMNTESKGGHKLDFSFHSIPFEFPGACKDPLHQTSPMEFIPVGDTYAHNHMNFGNFLWGAAGHSLGFSETALKAAAQYNSIFNSGTNGYKPQLDSDDDQLSISRGVNYSKMNHFRDRTWSSYTGISPLPQPEKK